MLNTSLLWTVAQIPSNACFHLSIRARFQMAEGALFGVQDASAYRPGDGRQLGGHSPLLPLSFFCLVFSHQLPQIEK